MAIHWQIPFKSLRSGTDYTVNIYDSTHSGNPVVLKGGAQPFTTQEDDNDDMFTPIRTQSGYIRIVDDGKDANGNTWNWKNMLPNTDTDRPVTLTSGGTVLWQGFMQAQNFGGVLYGNPQEREFPIQCALTTLEGTDINYTQKDMQNFAYLLNQIVMSIPETSRPQTIAIQGGAYAQQWLLKLIDWQNFTQNNNDEGVIARFNMYQCLEDFCRFWGWTARTHKQTLYLTCADDSGLTTFLTMNLTQLGTMAGGTTAGTTNATYSEVTLSGDIFASTDNNDYRQRGPNKAMVSADTNRLDVKIIDPLNDKTIKAIDDLGWSNEYVLYNDKTVRYTNDLLSINQPFLIGTARSGYGSFSRGRVAAAADQDRTIIDIIRIKKTFNSTSDDPYVSLETVYEHSFDNGFLMMYGETWRVGDRYTNPYNNFPFGNDSMYMRIGIGPSRTSSSTKWWNGTSWQTGMTTCLVGIGDIENYFDNDKNEFQFWIPQTVGYNHTNILQTDGLKGRLYVDFLGTSDTDIALINGERSFELKDFRIEFKRKNGVTLLELPSNYNITDLDRPDTLEYNASNQNNVRQEWNADCIYATNNSCKFSAGVIVNTDGTYCATVSYGANSTARPEQHLANRVTTYWASAKRKIETELRSNVIGDISPQHKVTLDYTTSHPVSICREWRDDVTKLTLIQL